jgi:signal transduction histidine kinase
MTYFAILAASDFSIVYLIAYIAELPTGEILLKHSVIRLMGLVLTKSLLSFIIYTIYKFKTVKGMFSKKHLFELSAFAVSMLLFLLYVVFKDINSNTEKLSDMSVLFFIVSLILILLFFFGVIKIAEFYENRQQMSLLSLRNRMLETSMAETEKTFSLWQSSLHDHKHNIIHLLALAKKNDINGIENCLEKEFKLLSQKLFYYKTGNDTVDAVLYIKQTLANENGITFLINAVIPQKCPVTDAHLCAILGNLTDNAINASKNEPEPHIEVSIRQIKNYLIIKVLNRFTAPDEKIFKPKKGQSFYGIGLKSVRHTVQSYNGEFTAKVENNMFSAKIMIQM